MEFLTLNEKNEINYTQFQSYIIKLIENLTQNKKCPKIIQLLSSQPPKNIYLSLFVFQKYKKCSNINFDNINDTENNNIQHFLLKVELIISKDDKKIKNIFIILIQWIYYLYLKLIKNLYSSEQNLCEVNIIRYLLKKQIIL